MEFINKHKPTHIGLEGLSFGSVSGSKDILAGNFWFVRTMISQIFPDIKITIVPVLTWRSKLFTKEERAKLKEYDLEVKKLKKLLPSMDKESKKIALEQNEEIILKSNIKYVTWEKVPEPFKSKFKELKFNKGCFDVTDAYFIAKYIESNIKKEN